MKNLVSMTTQTLAISLALAAAGCDSNNSTDNNPAPSPERFKSITASADNGGGKILIDSTAKLSWINDASLDTRGDGCVSPGAVGPIEPTKASEFCQNQQFAGFTDWRAPTAAELSDLITNAQAAGVKMNYLNPACPTVVGSDGFVRTENDGNPAVSTVFPNAVAGEILKGGDSQPITTIAGMNGVPAGLRCVRDGTETAPTPTTSARFEARDALPNAAGGGTLVDNTTRLEWVNDTELDSNGEGCISPAQAGPIEPAAADSRCASQNFAGHDDWRAPTAAELTELTKAAIAEGQPLKYLNPLCPAVVGKDGIVRTENANASAATAFPNAQAGDVLGASLDDLNGVGAGLRCVRDL